VLRLHGPEIAVGERAAELDDGRKRAFKLVGDETEHLHVGAHGRRELFDAIGLFYRLRDAFGDGHVERDFAFPVRVRLARTAEQKPDPPPVDRKRAGHAGADALAEEQARGFAVRVSIEIALQVVYDPGPSRFEYRRERTAADVGGVPAVEVKGSVCGTYVIE